MGNAESRLSRPLGMVPGVDAADLSHDIFDDPEIDIDELLRPAAGPASIWAQPHVARVLAFGGLLAGCAAGALALGPSGFLLTLVAEALAFAGGMLVSRSTREELEKTNRELHLQATRDPLTGLHNRGAIDEVLREQLRRAPERRISLSVILADIDRFKLINDTHGHQAGDEVLRDVARRMSAVCRAVDTVGRYGGEEILMILPETTGPEATLVAHRIRLSVAQDPVQTPFGDIPVTVSLGVASTEHAAILDPGVLIRAADMALYQAKREGRNRVALGRF